MKADSNKFIPLPDELDYSVSDFYDMDEDLCNEQCTRLYEEYNDIKKRYTEVTEIASGGMKTIYRAFDQKTGRYVAVAVLKNDMGEETHGPFLAEARLTAVLHHPNIIKIHDIDFGEDEKPYFTMDLKLGDSLSDIIKKLEENVSSYVEKYTLEEKLDIFVKVCNAVSYSHTQGILHLDIKPDNIQVGDHGEVLLCDWGLARYLGHAESQDNDLLDNEFLMGQTIMGKVRGTPGYMAPEMVNDKKKRCEQSDIYALGALLYALLAGLPPIEGNVDQILKKTSVGNVISPKERCPGKSIPSSLNAVVMKAMSFEIDQRYKTASELVEDVRKYLYGYATSAEETNVLKELSLFYKRNKTVCHVSLFSVFLISIFIGVFIVNLEQSRDKEMSLRIIAEEERTKAEINLKKYQQEKELADISLSADPSNVLAKIKKDYYQNFFSSPKGTLDRVMKSLERIKEANDSAMLLYEFKGDIHFLRQEFDLALLELKKGRGEFENRTLFKALVSIKDYKSDGGPAPVEIIQKMIHNLNGKYIQPLPKLLMYDNEVRANKEEHLELVKTVFTVANKVSELEEFSYDPSSKMLSISGDYRVYSFDIKSDGKRFPLFGTLPIDHLKIRGNKNLHGIALEGLKLKTLDIRGEKIRSKRQLIPKGVAEKIIVSEELSNKGILELLKKNSKVAFTLE
ncbi:MAG: serine/threonine protein kinase [Lentisphaeraceae bacterium]|nr:serine/threonine protein kinase [Lentisphaeraceae bacterium]